MAASNVWAGYADSFASLDEYTLHLRIGDSEAEFTNIHWTIEDYSRFFSGRFYIGQVREPEPDETFDAVHPHMFARSARYPIYMLLQCVRC